MPHSESPRERREQEREHEQEPDRGEPGAEGGSSAKDRAPGAPAPDDDTPLGDTDQHSSSNA